MHQAKNFPGERLCGERQLIPAQLHLEALVAFHQRRRGRSGHFGVADEARDGVEQHLLGRSIVERVEARSLDHCRTDELNPRLIEFDHTTLVGLNRSTAPRHTRCDVYRCRGRMMQPQFDGYCVSFRAQRGDASCRVIHESVDLQRKRPCKAQHRAQPARLGNCRSHHPDSLIGPGWLDLESLGKIGGQQAQRPLGNIRLGQCGLPVPGGCDGGMAPQRVPCQGARRLTGTSIEHRSWRAGQHDAVPGKGQGTVIELDGEGLHLLSDIRRKAHTVVRRLLRIRCHRRVVLDRRVLLRRPRWRFLRGSRRLCRRGLRGRLGFGRGHRLLLGRPQRHHCRAGADNPHHTQCHHDLFGFHTPSYSA